ncbi:MAG: glutamine-synthetase adenylyltransferase [Acidobacteria bacterium]|nr:glutamine-synthetase adenylyltransferase [Acidobacteriota bacterium]
MLRSYEEILKHHSRILFEEVRQHPDWLVGIQLDRAFEAHDFRNLLETLSFTNLALAAFRRRCLTRILLRDVLGHSSLSQTTAEVSALADAILEWSYEKLRAEAEATFGQPILENGRPCGCSILALGKLGGNELNYSSDIDLMYIYGGRGETTGPVKLTNREFFEKLAQHQTQFLGAYTPEGICYRVDLRLRPEGSLGEIATSMEAARDYYRLRARDWELQMMIKARVSAGEPEPGQALIQFVEPLTYRTTTDFSAIEAVSATRIRWNEKLANRKLLGGAIDVKLTRGGIRDIEFLVQCLQRLHGGRERWVRSTGTMIGLARLFDKTLISSSEHETLIEAYVFLRHLEHRLQIMEDRQTHTLPDSFEEIEDLARRMPTLDLGHENTGVRLIDRLKAHLASVESIYSRVIYGHQVPTSAPVDQPSNPQNRVQLERLQEQLEARWGSLDADPADLRELAALSPYLTDELIRQPEWLEELRAMRSTPYEPFTWQGEQGLRKAFRRRMFRIQCESLILGRGVFETLAANSDLADAVISHCYELAILDISKGEADVSNPMMIVSLGRLGLREFDLASDADIIFILPDEEQASLEFWTRIAARMIELLTAYTGDGMMFTVDARLRPFGREGDLVQPESTYMDYFAQHAEAWEGIAYMKARAVAGNTERATKFLKELQKVDWRRYGQSQRSKKQLSDMRARLEKEQGRNNPLKAGRGGFYDIDFLLLYLRLKSAGIFFKVLNTPQRIDVVEQMGHLEQDDAAFLMDAALLYRAIDHGMRLYTGQNTNLPPESAAAREALSSMLGRWLPAKPRHTNLESELAAVQERTRETFERLFT